MEKSLDRKIARILADTACRDFILADAKDADMAFGLAAPGRSPEHHAGEGRFRSLAEYRQLMREIVAQGQVDIMLMSASTSEMLVIEERLFDHSPVTPAARTNDTTDIWLANGAGRYSRSRRPPSAPRRSTTSSAARPSASRRSAAWAPTWGCIPSPSTTTWNWIGGRWRPTGRSASKPRARASAISWRSSTPTPPAPPADLARFVNDNIVRALAGVTSRGRPLFFKIVYHGPAAMEALASYDRSLVIGILGGSAGTTFDAFQMLWEAKKYGARAALYGRKINQRRAPIELRRAPPRRGRRPVASRGGRQVLSRRTATAGDLSPPLAGRRPGAHRDRLRRRWQAGRGEETAASQPDGKVCRTEAARARRARLQQDDRGRKGPMEPGPLETDYRVSSGRLPCGAGFATIGL